MKKILALFAAAMMTVSLSAATIYCKMTQNWWTKDGAAVGIYYWGSSSTNPNWPGYRMTSLGNGLWSYELPEDVTVVIFSRVNPSGAVTDWGAQTKNLPVPTDGKNLFTITNTTETWGSNPGCDGEWSVYDGSGTTPGGDDPGTGGDEQEDDVLWYAIGWINGGDHGEAAYDVYEDDYLFEEDGKLTIDCRMGSYIAIKDHMGNFYYSKTPTTIADERVTMEWANGWTGCQKWAIPEGINYIIVRSASFKNKIVLERVDKATYDAYHYSPGQGIEQVITSTKARKAIIDGQLRIIRGNKMFDATGREL